MTFNRHFIYSAVTALAVACPLQNALAACAGATAANAKWHFHGVEAAKTAGGVDVIKCVLTFKTGGNFTAPCTSYAAGSAAGMSVNVTGKIAINAACDITGSVTIPGNGVVLIKFGHINGVVGSGIGTHGAGAGTHVLHFSIIRQ